jgi:hypothetical protein
MGIPAEHIPVKLIIGLIGRETMLDKAAGILSRKFGSIDYVSPRLDFRYTDYYTAEMGSGLQRQFLSFKKPIAPGDLVRIKRWCNTVEQRCFSSGGNRGVNIDPGYLTLSKLVLATTKDHQHRLYLGKGIFAEVTLRFRNKTFMKWDWTYPDYCSPEYIGIFNHIRNTLVVRKGIREHAR